jgi:atypical dual specificity phosphatase
LSETDLPFDCDWMIDDRLCAMSWPTEAQLRMLRDIGFTMVVSVASEDTSPVRQACQLLGLKWLRYPVPDMTPPRLDQVRDFVAEVEAELARGGKAAVHCLGGVGRTGTMIACYLVSLGRTPAEAIDEVRRRRPGSVQTDDQELCVFRYYAWLQDPAGSLPDWGG